MAGIVSEMETRLPEGNQEGQSRLLDRLEAALWDTEASFRRKLESL
jgi:hypothetical protein